MKSTLYKLFACGFLAICTFWPTSCARILDIPANPDAVVAKGDVTGRVVLPQGTTWSADELTILSGNSEDKVNKGLFTIVKVDTSSYKLLIAQRVNGQIALIGPLLSGYQDIELSAKSSALGLLMINPMLVSISESAKSKLATAYQQHELFPDLVNEVEVLVQSGKELASKDNTQLISLLERIHKSNFKVGGRRAAKSILTDKDVIDFAFVGKNGIKIVNTGSFLPYAAAIYDSSDLTKELKLLPLESMRFGKTSTADIFKDAITYFLNKPDDLGACYRDFVSRPLGNKPTTICGNFNSMQLVYPSEQTHAFEQDGKYIIKVANPFVFNLLHPIGTDTRLRTVALFLQDALTLLNPSIIKETNFEDCNFKKDLKVTEDLFKVVSNFFLEGEERTLEWWDLTVLLAGFFQSVYDVVNECLFKGTSSKLYATTAVKLLGFLDVFDRAGAGVNLWFMGESFRNDKAYYEYCVQVKSGSISICGKESVDEPIPNEVKESPTAVSTADPHLTTFDRGRYSFMGVGEFIAAKSTTDNFLVQVRQSPYLSSTQVSVNTGLAVRVGSDVVSVYPPDRLYVNRRTVPLNFTTYPLSNGGSLAYQGDRLTIATASDDRVEVKLLAADLDYFITPGKARKNKLRGLLGNYDGNPQNDLQKADGQVLTNTYAALYPAFADSWRVNQTESLFEYEGRNPASFTDINFPRSEVQLSAAQRTAAEQICRQAGVTDAGALAGCIVDVALTGNQTFASRAKENEIVSNAKTTLSVSNFAQYRNEFILGSGAVINGTTAVLADKGTIRWQDAYLNREGYETEVVLSVNAPGPCFPLFDLEVIDNQATGNPNDNYLRLSANSGRTQVELVNSGVRAQPHPVNLFDGNRHRIRVVATKQPNGAQTQVRLLIYIDSYEPLVVDKTFVTASLAGYLYPMLKNETLRCTNSQITIYGWSFKGE